MKTVGKVSQKGGKAQQRHRQPTTATRPLQIRPQFCQGRLRGLNELCFFLLTAMMFNKMDKSKLFVRFIEQRAYENPQILTFP